MSARRFMIWVTVDMYIAHTLCGKGSSCILAMVGTTFGMDIYGNTDSGQQDPNTFFFINMAASNYIDNDTFEFWSRNFLLKEIWIPLT